MPGTKGNGSRAAGTGGPRARVRGAASPKGLLVLLLVLGLAAAAAWWFLFRPQGATTGAAPATGRPAASTPGASGPAADAEVEPDAAALGELDVNDLYREARKAMSENRLVSPPGKNALEYYLAILQKQPDDTGAVDALRELFPFASGSAEEQINTGDYNEAARIIDLLAKADSSNYTLTILRSKLDARRKREEREQALQEAAAAAAAARTAAAATASPAARTPEAETPAEAAAQAAPEPEPARAPAVASTPRPATAAPPAPAQPVGETRDVRVLTPPRPSYPPNAVRARQEGWVEIEFTVAADGSVRNARVVDSQPARVFDREAIRAVQQATFEPRLERGQPVSTTLRRRIQFSLSGG